MPFSMYDVSVPLFRQVLTGVLGVVEKAKAHAAETGADEVAWTASRIYEDMQPFTFQVMQAIRHSAGAVAKLTGGDYPAATGLETFAGCETALTAALASLDAVTPADLEDKEDGEVVMTFPRGEQTFVGRDFLLTFALPNFYFHATTAYDLMRAKGVPVGKRDFMGRGRAA